MDSPKLDTLRNRFLSEYDQHIQQHDRSSVATIYDGMPLLLNALEERNITWGIITNKPEAYAALLLKQCKLNHRYHTLICPEQVKNTKPDPESLLLACKETNTSPEHSIYIGDHLRDIEAGRNAGMYTITALYGFIPEYENPEYWPSHHAITHASEILPWLEQQKWHIPRRPEDV